MNDALVVRRRDGREDRKRDVDDLVERHRPRAPQVPRQVLAFQVLHHEEGLFAVQADVGDVDRMRVTDARRQLRLQQEPGARLRHGRERRADRLCRDALADLDVQALVNRAHAALAQQTDDPVLAKHGPRCQRPPRAASRLLPSHSADPPYAAQT
jgi:hypothetical protein